MPRKRKLISASLLGAGLLWLGGCSLSDSSVSISDSGSSISKSSSSSSNRGIPEARQPYRDDVANLTYSVVNSSMTSTEFPTALARTAREFEISDWSQEKATFYGIGKGLRKAGITKNRIATTPILGEVLEANPEALRYIQEGYQN